MPKKIPYRNKSPFGWWIASYLMRFEWKDEDRGNPNRRCLAWENTIIVRARNRDQAYRKAVRFGRLQGEDRWSARVGGRTGRWRFEGLTHLLPIYDELEDGAEVLWTEHLHRPLRAVRRLVRAKSKLEAFDDSAV